MKSERQDIELHSGEDLNMWESIESVEDEVPQSSDEFSLNSPQFQVDAEETNKSLKDLIRDKVENRCIEMVWFGGITN